MINNIVSLPTQKNYEVATDTVGELFRSEGGARTSIFKMELSSRSNQNKYAILARLGSLSGYVEIYDSDEKLVDPLRSQTHAFKHGALAGSLVIDLVHNGLISFPATIEALHLMVTPTEKLDLRDSRFIIASQLVMLGEKGLEGAGERVLEDIDAWEQKVVSDVRAQRMFRLGCGAVMHAAYLLHSTLNKELINKEVESTDFDKELDLILNPDTSEND